MSRKRKSYFKRWIVFGVIVIALAAASIYLFQPKEVYQSITAKTGDITTYYTFSGNVETKNRQTVISETMMQISEVNVKDGDIVKKGDVLFKTTTNENIEAKIEGEIVNLNMEENELIMAGIKLLEIVDFNDLKISVKVDEYDIIAFEKGRETTVKIGAINKEIKGTVSNISKEGNIINGVTYFPATINLEKNKGIMIGMSADVKLISNNAIGVVTLPMETIQFDENNKPFVLKKDQNNEIVKTQITTGINDGTKVEIKSGVSNGEEVFFKKAIATEDKGFPRGGPPRSNNARGEA